MTRSWTRRDVLRTGLVVAAGSALAPVAALASSPTGSLERAVRRAAETAHAPSVSAAAILGGEVVWADAFGWADVERERGSTAHTIYNVASVSKLVTTVAVLQAVEDGALDLDRDVNEVLPFEVTHPERRRVTITPRHLLTHTSGIRDAWSTLIDLYVKGDSPISLRRCLEGYLVPGGRWFDRGANFTDHPPGERHVYGNVGFALAGYLVEAATGTPFDAWCQERIFLPLGMERTSWHLEDLDRRSIALPYDYLHRNGTWRSYGLYGYPDYPDGLLRTTAPELARFLAALSNGGRWRHELLLGPATVDEMLTDQLAALSAPWQGLGVYRVHPEGGEALLGHNGGDLGVFADAWFRPSDGAGAVVLANVTAWRASEWRALVDLRNAVVEAAPEL